MAEVTVVGRLAVNGTEEVELFDDVGGLETEGAEDGVLQFALADFVRAEGVDRDRDRLGITDGVGELDFGAVREAGGHDVLGHPASHVGGAAVDFARVLAAESSAAVTAHAAVAVDDDFASGQAGVALRSADDEFAGRVDQILGVLGQHLGRENLLDQVVDDELFDRVVGNAIGVLRGDDHGGDFFRLAVDIAHGDLRLRVGAEPGGFAALADLGQFASKSVGEHDRRGHQFRCLVAGIAEHEALVAGALLGGLFAFGFLCVNALRDVLALLGDRFGDDHLVGVENVVVVDVADFPDGLTHDLFEIEFGVRRDFTGEHHHVALDQRFAGHTAFFVLGQARVEHGVGNGVADFVGVAFANRLGGKDIVRGHWN